MGVKADLKAARARMQAGDPAEAFSMVQQILDSASPDLKDAQTLYAVLVTAGLAGLASQDLTKAERSFRRAAESIPDAPQAWKGLIDTLERAGAEKVEALPECLSRAAEIAEGKGNFSRARTLRVRLGTVLDSLGRQEEALEAVLHHLDNPEATPTGDDGATSTPAAAIERLSLLLLAAVLEVDKEETAVARRVEKRLAKDGSSISIGSTGSLNAATAGSRRGRASALAFEYRAKALAKDLASSEDGSTAVGKRLADAMEELISAAQAESGQGNGLMMTQETQPEGDSDAGRGPWKALVARFCRTYLGRAFQSAESGVGTGGPSDHLSTTSSSSRWQEVLTACAAVERAVGESGWDKGWAATARFLASAYANPDPDRNPEVGTDNNNDNDNDSDAVTALDLSKIAKEAASVNNGRPWLQAEACLHLAGVALRAGDVADADTLLKTASATAAAAATASRAQHQQRTASSKDGGFGDTGGGGSWAGSLSGPGGGWRELALRCLVDERLGTAGAGDATGAAALALDRVDAAVAAFDESFRLRGAPANSTGGYTDVLGGLGLARASLLLKLGRLEEARLAVEMVSAGALDAARSGSLPTAEQSRAAAAGAGGRSPSLHHRALCVASELDLSEGEMENAKEKLRAVLDEDPCSADALSRLGWLLLLGFGGRGAADGNGERVGSSREDVEAARPLLERAVAEEPGCSSHAYRLARCYWEVGGEYREDRKFCFNLLLKAAKLDPSNAEAFEWLGYWYQGIGGDRERARGCYMRCVKLDPSMSGAGEALVSLYLENGQDTLAVALFRQCAAVSVACHWAWAGLGRAKILEGKLPEAASHLQQAIRGCPTSWSYWSDLGWCYHAEGKQAAALKAYTRAEELLADQQGQDQLRPQEEEEGSSSTAEGSAAAAAAAVRVRLAARVRVRTQVGTIQRQIGQVDEAVLSFQDAIALDPESRLALEGAGEAYLAQAHARTTEGLYTAATTALRSGCEATRRFLALLAAPATPAAAATAAAGGGGECAWKLLGDLYTYAHKLPPMCFEADGSRERGAGEGGRCKAGTAEAAVEQAALAKDSARNRLAFVAQGKDAYEEVVQLIAARQGGSSAVEEGKGTEDQKGEEEALATKAAAFYDLGLNYLLRARMACSDAGEGSGLFAQEVYQDLPEVAELARSAEQAFKRSIEAEPSYSEAWNGLGSVSRDPLVQQHCWVRAVQLEHNPSAWANLGMLYLRWGLDIQAYESFGGLQAVTDHPTMWVGLGLLKEKNANGPDVTAAKRRRLLSQASDAYYSSLETGQHVDGLLGLGTTAGQTHSQPDALVALQQHLDLTPNSAQAWNCLGAASELAGRSSQAITAYRRALGLLEEQGERFKAAGSIGAGEVEVWEELVRLARVNLGRALVLAGEAEEAVSCLGASDLAQMPDSMLQLGRAHALLGDWDGSLATLEKGDLGVNGLVSAAVVRWLKGDVSGTSATIGALMAQHPKDRRVLLTVLSLAALAGDAGLVQRASRALQSLPKRATASDSDGRLSRQHAADEDLWAVHLAMRAVGAPGAASRRALSKAVHLSPSSVSSWARLGAATADAAAHVECHPPSTAAENGTSGGGGEGGGGGGGGGEVSSKLAEACLAATEKHAMFSLLGKARDAGGSGSSSSAGNGNGARGGTDGEFAAKELATTLSGIAKAAMCGGGGGNSKSGNEVGASGRAMRATSRAVHLYPGETLAWRCLATALVGDALSSASKSPQARDAMLGDAHSLYQVCCSSESDVLGVDRPSDDSLVRAEAEYPRLLLLRGTKATDNMDGSDGTFASSLMAARAAALSGGGGGADGGRENILQRYKLALRVQPRSLVAWRELATCYERWGHRHASTAALKCGARALCPVPGDGDGDGDGGGGDGSEKQPRRGPFARAAPLYLQAAATSLSMMAPRGAEEKGQGEEGGGGGEGDAATAAGALAVGLASVGDAFRVGKGGAAGHTLRGLINSRLGKDGHASSAFAKAREAGLDPTVAVLVDRVAATPGMASVDAC